jgi:adenosylhomocysteine nucleosidase
MSRIAIIAALPGELKHLVRGWERRGRNYWAGHICEYEAVAIAGGIGAAAAGRAAERVIGEFKADVLVSFGWAGALTCAVKPRMACAISEVIDAGTGERFVTDYPEGYRLITLDRVARADEKRALAAQHQAVLVDMEAAAVARVAARRNVSFYSFKGVSDGYTDLLPDFSRFLGSGGEFRMAGFLAYAAVRPKYWASLQRLGKNGRDVAASLVPFMQNCLKQSL